jgi:ABC-type glycerol-3-phosphate transport system substrate-binding protein
MKFNSPLHVKHLQTLVDLQKDKTYDYSGRDSRSEGRFTSGECAIFLETVGTQEYTLDRAEFSKRVAVTYGSDAAAEIESKLRV